MNNLSSMMTHRHSAPSNGASDESRRSADLALPEWEEGALGVCAVAPQPGAGLFQYRLVFNRQRGQQGFVVLAAAFAQGLFQRQRGPHETLGAQGAHRAAHHVEDAAGLVSPAVAQRDAG